MAYEDDSLDAHGDQPDTACARQETVTGSSACASGRQLLGGTLEVSAANGTFRIHARLPYTGRQRRDRRVLLVDDDDLMRAGLRAVLSSDESIDVVGEAGDGRAAVEEAIRLRPDVVLMDVRMPRWTGSRRRAKSWRPHPAVKVAVLTTFEQDDYIFGALSAGASGFLLKRTKPEELIAAIHTIAAGGLAALTVRHAEGESSAWPGSSKPDPSALKRLDG